jgi:hypothetical protein
MTNAAAVWVMPDLTFPDAVLSDPAVPMQWSTAPPAGSLLRHPQLGRDPARHRLPGSWGEKVATWLFVLPLFVAGYTSSSPTTPQYEVKAGRIEIAGLALLLVGALVGLVKIRGRDPARARDRILTGFGFWSLVLVASLWHGYPIGAGSAGQYLKQGLILAAAYATVVGYAAAFYRPALLEEVAWRCARFFTLLGVGAWVASEAAHREIRVNAIRHSYRLQGTLSEPSAWSPILVVLALLAWRKRSWHYIGLAIVAALLSFSPICFIVVATTIPLYILLTGPAAWRLSLLVIIALATPITIGFLLSADPAPYLTSSNHARAEIGRLMSGLQNVESGGTTGTNERYKSLLVTIAAARQNDWIRTGAGVGAADVYFPARFPATARSLSVEPDTMWEDVLFDFGEGGVVVLAGLALVAVWRMRRHPGPAALLLPFFVASAVNSAEGIAMYQFVILGILLFAFGWERVVTPPAAIRACEDEGVKSR